MPNSSLTELLHLKTAVLALLKKARSRLVNLVVSPIEDVRRDQKVYEVKID